VHEGLERVMRRGVELGRVAEALEQHDARRAARLAQRDRFAEARDRERVGAGERLCRRREPVAVGIRLDDRDDPAGRGEFADPGEVVSERRRVDDGAQRPVQNAPSPYDSATRFSKRVYSPRKVSWISPVGPLRCFAMMMSAIPRRVVFWSYCSSR
jgi:hypothetical protein